MVRNLVIVAILVLALSNKVKGACNPSACNSEQTRYLRILSDNPTLQELCQSGNAYIDCAKRILTDCGADSYVSQLERMQKLMNEKGCGSAGKLFVCSPLLILLLFLSKSVN